MVLANLLILIGVTIFVFKRGGLAAAIMYVFGMFALLVASALGVPTWATCVMAFWLAAILPKRNPEPKI